MERCGFTQDDPISIKKGKKYIKLIAGTSVVAFINHTTGAIYMPASWQSPAKHIRGNIYSKEYGMEAFDTSGNVRYLR
jgi:hypothetical protein